MSVVDVLVTIIVVTILVTIVLGVVTYIAYKLRLARRPIAAEAEEGTPRYFVYHTPPAERSHASVEAGSAAGGGAGATDPGSAAVGPDDEPHPPTSRERELTAGQHTVAGDLA